MGSKKQKRRDWMDANVLRYLRELKADDPECCDEEALDIAEILGESTLEVQESLDRLVATGDVFIESDWGPTYMASGGRLTWSAPPRDQDGER